jgi:hypothetical protein
MSFQFHATVRYEVQPVTKDCIYLRSQVEVQPLNVEFCTRLGNRVEKITLAIFYSGPRRNRLQIFNSRNFGVARFDDRVGLAVRRHHRLGDGRVTDRKQGEVIDVHVFDP